MMARRKAEPEEATASPDRWRLRIVGEGEEAPDQLLANPFNWRVHPSFQQAALAAVLDEVGWVQRVLVNQQTGHMVDGHLRVALAITRGEASVPVTYLDLDPDEERKVLATFDPIGALAAPDRDKLRELLAEVTAGSEATDALLRQLQEQVGAVVEPPDAFPEPNLETDHACPSCGYEWNGPCR
ncbi:MAG: hypothetical protein A2V88_12860 [Elusimicrobia bacterium RBG_16_66_12]|nr:MAG: hypothetical protein A2V88_12860 [Elusimicrobia bacterium RBG_16_66_12]